MQYTELQLDKKWSVALSSTKTWTSHWLGSNSLKFFRLPNYILLDTTSTQIFTLKHHYVICYKTVVGLCMEYLLVSRKKKILCKLVIILRVVDHTWQRIILCYEVWVWGEIQINETVKEMTPASPLYNGDFKSVILQLLWKYTLSTAKEKSGFISKPFLVRDTYVYACLNTTFDFSD